MHPLDIPDSAKFYSLMTAGNPSIVGEGIKVNIWMGQMPDLKGKGGALRWELYYKIVVTLIFTHLSGHYSTSVTMGCLPISTFYNTESGSVLIKLVFLIFITVSMLVCFIR